MNTRQRQRQHHRAVQSSIAAAAVVVEQHSSHVTSGWSRMPEVCRWEHGAGDEGSSHVVTGCWLSRGDVGGGRAGSPCYMVISIAAPKLDDRLTHS
eukprot:COSAG01_NODE_859_length_13066_cov_83.717822_4_plen_96_part_00